MEETEIIKQTPNYNLIIGNSVDSGNKCYQVVNRIYNIVEIEIYLLPQALKYLGDLQAGLDALADQEEGNKKLNSVVKILA